MTTSPNPRLEYLREQIRKEQISYGEIAELQDLADTIDPYDVELLEWAGVPEDEARRRQEGRGRTIPVMMPGALYAHFDPQTDQIVHWTFMPPLEAQPVVDDEWDDDIDVSADYDNTNPPPFYKALHAALADATFPVEWTEDGYDTRGYGPREKVTRFIATFHPQAWIRDYATEVDAEGDTTWDATEAFRQLDDETRARMLAEMHRCGEALDRDDLLKSDPNAPEWVREWSGPFDIWVTDLESA